MTQKTTRWAIAALLATSWAGAATVADASETKFQMLERRGEFVVVTHEVGNQTLPLQYVANDGRRHAADGMQLYYAIDLTEPAPGFTMDETEAAIERAVATFNGVNCGRMELVRRPSQPVGDLGYAQHLVGLGGAAEPLADITFAGWVPPAFFPALGFPNANGLTVPMTFDADEASIVPGFDPLASPDEYSDVDGDGNADLFATEIYFIDSATYSTDDSEGDSLFVIDLESIVLHELGHAVGMDHFGRTEIIVTEDLEFVDIRLNPHSTPLMNSNNFLVTRELSGSDVGSFCGIYANWGTPGRGG